MLASQARLRLAGLRRFFFRSGLPSFIRSMFWTRAAGSLRLAFFFGLVAMGQVYRVGCRREPWRPLESRYEAGRPRACAPGWRSGLLPLRVTVLLLLERRPDCGGAVAGVVGVFGADLDLRVFGWREQLSGCLGALQVLVVMGVDHFW